YKRLPPKHAIYRVLNQLAWGTEFAAALAMLFPPTRFLGGMILIGTFAFIATQIRLGLLCEMVMLSGVLFFAPDTLGEQLIESTSLSSPSQPVPGRWFPTTGTRPFIDSRMCAR